MYLKSGRYFIVIKKKALWKRIVCVHLTSENVKGRQ